MADKQQAADQLGHNLWNDWIRDYFYILLSKHVTLEDAQNDVKSMLQRNTLRIKTSERDEVEVPLDEHAKSLLEYSLGSYLLRLSKEEKDAGKALNFLIEAQCLFSKASNILKDCEKSECNLSCFYWICLGDSNTDFNLVKFYYQTAWETGCPTSIEAAEKLATLYIKTSHNLPDARLILEAALKQAEKQSNSYLIDTILARLTLGKLLRDLKDGDALNVLLRAERDAISTLGEIHDLTLQCNLSVIVCRIYHGEYLKALGVLDCFLEELQRFDILPGDEIIQKSKFWKAFSHCKMGDLILAKCIYAEVVHDETKFNRPGSKLANDARQDLADIYLSEGNFKRAKIFSEVALGYRHDQQDPHIAGSMVSLADAHRGLGKLKEAEDMYKEALVWLELSSGSNSNLRSRAESGRSMCQGLKEAETPTEDTH